tara:strand:- start:11849 stop:12277 length:429 start_codon:yes stop_codon:yes gene_type:complete
MGINCVKVAQIVMTVGKIHKVFAIPFHQPHGTHTSMSTNHGTGVVVAIPVKERVNPVIHHAVKISTIKDATSSQQVHAWIARPAKITISVRIVNYFQRAIAVSIARRGDTSQIAWTWVLVFLHELYVTVLYALIAPNHLGTV